MPRDLEQFRNDPQPGDPALIDKDKAYSRRCVFRNIYTVTYRARLGRVFNVPIATWREWAKDATMEWKDAR